MPVIEGPSRNIRKATLRLNPCVDLDVDVLAVKRAAGASTTEDWSKATFTGTDIRESGVITLSESTGITFFKTPGVVSDPNVHRTFNNGGSVGDLWLDFWPDPAVVGSHGFMLKSIDLLLARTGFSDDKPMFQIKVAQFDENWNREELIDPIYIYGKDVPRGGGLITVDFRERGYTIKLRSGRIKSRTGSGTTSSGGGSPTLTERTNDFTVEDGVKVSHIEVPLGFSVGIVPLFGFPFLDPFIFSLPTSFGNFDVNQSWRCTEAVGKSMGPYSPGVKGSSALDISKYPGYGYAETWFVPGYGSKATAQLTGGVANGQWGISAPVHFQNGDHVGNNIFNQPYHNLKVVNYSSSGTVVNIFDLGAVPTNEVHFRVDTVIPSGCAVTYSLRGSNDHGVTWSSPWTALDNDVFSGTKLYRWYEVTITMTGSSDQLTSPQIISLFLTERIRFATWKYVEDFDCTTSIDPTTGQSSIAELKLPILRLGRGDARDLATKIASDYPLANIEAWVYLRQTLSGERYFLNLYRLENRDPDLGEENFTFVSGMDRLKVMVPPKVETDVYPFGAGTTGKIKSFTYDTVTNILTVTVLGTPFAGKDITGWRVEWLTGTLASRDYFVSDLVTPTDFQFSIVLEDDSLVPANGDQFKLHSGVSSRPSVNYTGLDFAEAYSDLLQVQAAVPSRYIGTLPTSTGRICQGILESQGRAAIEPLQELALHIGGSIAWIKGRISYINIYGPKTSVETWSEKDYFDLKLTTGADRRMPSVTVKYNYDYVEGTFQQEVTYEDGNALLGMGRANLFDSSELDDDLCKWNDGPEGEHLANKLLEAWSTGVRVWRVSLIHPRPWRNEGDPVTISTDQYTDRRLKFTADGITDQGEPIRGRVSAVGVIVGKNLDGTVFDVAIPGLNSVQPVVTSGDTGQQNATRRILNNFRWIDSADGTTRTFMWDRGGDVQAVLIFDQNLPSPPTVDPWPGLGSSPTVTLDVGTDQYTVIKPLDGNQRFIQFEPRTLGGLDSNTFRRAVVDPAPASLAVTITPTVTNGVADLLISIKGSVSDYPANMYVYEDSTTSVPIVVATANADVSYDKFTFAALGGRALPLREARRWWIKGVNVAGKESWGTAAADRDALPVGEVTPLDYTFNPKLKVLVDDDTDLVRITTPSGTKTVSRVGGTLVGATYTYTVGDVLDTAGTENAFTVNETRSGYKVEVQGGSVFLNVWDGSLHGPIPPVGTVTAIDGVANPQLKVLINTDTTQVKVTVPGGTKTVTRGGGTLTGTSYTYTVGDTLDLGGVETALAMNEIRSGYKVEITGLNQTITIWQGSLYGPMPPFGAVSVFDFSTNPQLKVAVTDDVTGVRVTTPAGLKNVTRGGGTLVGNSYTYTVGDTLDLGGTEAAFITGERRTGYKVEILKGAFSTIWEGSLHGVGPSAAPSATMSFDPIPGNNSAQAQVSIQADGADNVRSWRLLISTSSQPSDASTISGGSLFVGRNLSAPTLSTINLSQTVFGTLVPFENTLGTGTPLPSIHIRGTFSTFEQLKVVTFSASSWVSNPGLAIIRVPFGGIANPALANSGSAGAQLVSILLPPGTVSLGWDIDCEWNTAAEPLSTVIFTLWSPIGGGLWTIGTGSPTYGGGVQTVHIADSTTWVSGTSGFLDCTFTATSSATFCTTSQAKARSVTATYKMGSPTKAY